VLVVLLGCVAPQRQLQGGVRGIEGQDEVKSAGSLHLHRFSFFFFFFNAGTWTGKWM
jgi:hypothetical protein